MPWKRTRPLEHRQEVASKLLELETANKILAQVGNPSKATLVGKLILIKRTIFDYVS
jgi:hypothetical protein